MSQTYASDFADSPHGAGTARLLGWLGLLPFWGGAVTAWAAGSGPVADGAVWLVTAYGAVILSFIGGVRWGRLLRQGERADAAAMGGFAWSIVPAVVGWTALLLPVLAGLPLMLAGFALAWWVDRRAVDAGRLPRWYGALRDRLSAGVCLALGVTMIAAL